jgi:hypothetical protein
VGADAIWGRLVLIGPSGEDLLTIVVKGPGRPDLATVDMLARWQLWARRSGGSVRLRETSKELACFLELVGLLREVGGQPEVGEESGRVEEGVDRRDPLP